MCTSIDRTSTNNTYSAEGSTASQGAESAVLPYLIAPANERCPVYKLPTELTGNILTLVVWEHAEITHQYMEVNEEQEYDIRTRLSLVCKRWKEITQGTALIWSNVYIDDQTPLLRVANYMERSKQCGLRIKSLAEVYDKPSFFDDIWPLISPHVSRLVEFDFELGCIDALPCPLHHGDNRRRALYSLARAGQAPRLKKLRLRFCAERKTYMEDREESVVTLFGGQTPALTYLELLGVNVDWEGMRCLKALEVLKLEPLVENIRPSYNVFARVLSSLPNLKTLHLCSSGPSGSPTDRPSDGIITVISTLENLVLTQRSCAYVCALLTRFTFPNLKSLAVDLPERPYACNFDSFVDYLCSHRLVVPESSGEPAERLLEPMASRLEHLQLEYLQCSSAAMQQLLDSLINLRTLSLGTCECQPSFRTRHEEFVPNLLTHLKTGFTGITNPATARTDFPLISILLPRLEYLIFDGYHVQELKNFRDWRAAVGYPLRELRYYNKVIHKTFMDGECM